MTDARTDDETLQELFIACASRWRTAEGQLGIGVPKKKLLEALGIEEAGLRPLLDQLTGRLAPLGLDLVEYYYARDRWYAVKSVFPAPNELDEYELAALGVVIAMV